MCVYIYIYMYRYRCYTIHTLYMYDDDNIQCYVCYMHNVCVYIIYNIRALVLQHNYEKSQVVIGKSCTSYYKKAMFHSSV